MIFFVIATRRNIWVRSTDPTQLNSTLLLIPDILATCRAIFNSTGLRIPTLRLDSHNPVEASTLLKVLPRELLLRAMRYVSLHDRTVQCTAGGQSDGESGASVIIFIMSYHWRMLGVFCILYMRFFRLILEKSIRRCQTTFFFSINITRTSLGLQMFSLIG